MTSSAARVSWIFIFILKLGNWGDIFKKKKLLFLWRFTYNWKQETLITLFFCHETNDNTLEKLIELPNQFWYWVFNKSQYVYWLLLTVKQLSSCTLNQLLLFCLICFEVFMGLISFFTCRSLNTIYRQERLETYCLNLDLPSYYFNFVYAQSTNNTNQSYKLTTLY